MRVVNWSWKEADEMVAKGARARQLKAANVLADEVRRRCPVGTVSRPMYRRGPYAGQPWTKHDAGALKRSIRVVEKKGAGFTGHVIKDLGGVRCYAGHYYAWYAAIVEYFKPFMRPAVEASKTKVKNILENG